MRNRKSEKSSKIGSPRSASQGLHPRRKGAACLDASTLPPRGGAIEARRPEGQRATKVERLAPDDDCSGLTQAAKDDSAPTKHGTGTAAQAHELTLTEHNGAQGGEPPLKQRVWQGDHGPRSTEHKR